MKNILLFLAGVIVLASVTTSVKAATETATVASVAATPVPVAAEEYILPYPGVLPDNPLYFLKTVRDRIMEWLIADPLRKIDFYVLQSDKNLNAAILLHQANKKTLVTGTLTQSIADMTKAVSLASSVRNSGKEVPTGVVEHMSRSLTKHEEVLTSLANESLLTKVKSLEEAVNKLK
jgi:hypothetical protein